MVKAEVMRGKLSCRGGAAGWLRRGEFSRSPPEKSATPPRRNVRALAWAAGWRVAALRMLRMVRGGGGRAAAGAGAGARAFRSCQGCRCFGLERFLTG